MTTARMDLLGADALVQYADAWSKQVKEDIDKLFRQTGFRWQAEAVKRVPVATGFLKQKIQNTVFKDAGGNLVVAVGTNVVDSQTGFNYPLALEFGTKFIAGGKVKRIGDKAKVRDVEAVHSWPAKDGNAIRGTSASVDQSGETRGRLRDAGGRFTGGAQEQMPWLRTAWTSGTQPWFLQRYNLIITPRHQPEPVS